MIHHIDLDSNIDSLTLYNIIRKQFQNTVLLESMDPPNQYARQSIICFQPKYMLRIENKCLAIDNVIVAEGIENIIKEFRRIIQSYHLERDENTYFKGGILGYTSFNFVNYYEDIINSNKEYSGFPDGHYGLYLDGIMFDHFENTIQYFYQDQTPSRFEKIKELIENYKEVVIKDSEFSVNQIRYLVDQEEFEKEVKEIKDLIIQGETFQTVISQIVEFELDGDRFDLYMKLRKINPSPYMYCIEFENLSIIGSSPELLVSLENDVITSYPIAGTRPVGNNDREYQENVEDLTTDEKEKAEHNMLVDLARNDLGKVSQFGSVVVEDYLKVEVFSHVIHLVSKVVGQLDPKYDMFDSFLATFPAGTVSGAPKIRAMKIIDKLESFPRGPYAGAVGYFDFAGNMVHAITIRTAFGIGNQFKIQAGAGIVLDSNPELEYHETLSKLGAFLQIFEEVAIITRENP